MKTKKFLMTSLLVMGMIIAKAANGFPPELVLVSQPVLTYNANSVTIYYDVQNIGDYAYRGNIYLYLDPDDGYYYAREYVRVCPGRIKRIAISIPAYRPNPSWTYTVMPYYELGDELYSFTTFEYFEPVRFCWHGYRNEPWVVITVGPRPRYYHRPGDYRYYYDGYRPMMPPPPPGHGPHPHDMPPMDPHHHTYGYHHGHGGYPANHHPDKPVPGYNHVEPETPNGGGSSHSGSSGTATVRPHVSGNTNSMSTGGNGGGGNNGSSMSSGGNGGHSSTTVTVTRPSGNNSGSSSSSNSSNVSRPSGNSSSTSSGRPSGDNGSSSSSSSNSGSVSRPSGNSSSSGSGRPSGNSSSSSSSVSRPSGNSSSSGSSSGRSGSSSSSSSSSRGGSSSSSSSSSSGRSGSSSGGRR